jgi:uncharacterized tellurite resistance protein B-like protein
MSILNWLGFGGGGEVRHDGDTDAVRRIAAELERLDPARARHIAAFAYLLGRVAYADREVSPDETRLMERIVMERGGLPEDQAVLVVQIAKSQNALFGGTEDFLVAREFATLATYEQKTALVDCLFGVAAADGSITAVEDAEIVRVATALRVEHADVVRARVAHKEYLSVLRKPQPPGAEDAS